MCEPPKEKPENNEETKPSYYYDDSHGYEDYDPELEDEEIEKEPPNE
ncbi:MAG TPA: hypothetical protein PKA82_06610 [Pyrinomonadaceae bacterium]|nr:hypothetical protein [Pyrinomonadaceae bacterium]